MTSVSHEESVPNSCSVIRCTVAHMRRDLEVLRLRKCSSKGSFHLRAQQQGPAGVWCILVFVLPLNLYWFDFLYFVIYRAVTHTVNLSFLVSQSAGLRPGQARGSRRSPTGENGWLRQQPGWGQLVSCSHWWGITRGFRYPSCRFITSCLSVLFYISNLSVFKSTKCVWGIKPPQARRGF